MFIGREKELATLNGLYNSDKFEFAVSDHKGLYQG